MKKELIKLHFTLLAFMLFGAFSPLLAQPQLSTGDAGQLVEKLSVITDRNVYAVDDEIRFSAMNCSSEELRQSDWSHVLYVELIAPDGESLIRSKKDFTDGFSSGSLRIPPSLLTGNYYLRAYTRWMRDYSPYAYFYKIITIINPSRPELLEPAGSSGRDENPEMVTPGGLGAVSIRMAKTVYAKRESVHIELSNAGAGAGRYTVSVVPEGAEKQLVPSVSHTGIQQFVPEFIPETRGLSISGKVVSETDSVPLAFTLVGLTILKKVPESRSILTNEKGQFFFDLGKIEGEYEVFISARPREKVVPLILVDNDFSAQKVKLPFVPVDFSDEQKEVYQRLIFNSQMNLLYRKRMLVQKLSTIANDSVFYGKPDFSIRLKDYIPMPSIKDYIYELIPQVGVRRVGKRNVFKVLGIYSDLSVFEPLVLVDMVPIFDVDRVLELLPEKIDRIEVVAAPYVRGDIVFGGIISFFSKNNDLAGISLPTAGRFINYEMLNPESFVSGPDLDDFRTPVLGSCLYWNPNFKWEGSNPAEIALNAGDEPGKYVVVVSHVDEKGHQSAVISHFSVN